ncbi:MAG: hypothetical protein HY897_25685 [Deltaproteobacteria bacterium]|nr:hypothetical protein [Deltaproteobacteria bacterium]
MRRLFLVLAVPVVLLVLYLPGCANPQPLSHTGPVGLPPAAEEPVARIVASGAIDCFPKGLKTEDGSPATCEVSAAVLRGDVLVLASDKPVPGGHRSSVFKVPFVGALPRQVTPEKISYVTAKPFVSAAKFEGMTVTPDGEYHFATTGFDRFDPGSPKFDAYDTLLFWPAGREALVSLVTPSSRDGVESSAGVWQKLSAAQKSDEFPAGVPYFKVEGLAAIPGDALLFGIREAGKDYKNFAYTVRIISVPYMVRDCHAILGDEVKVLFDVAGRALSDGAGIAETVALSSLEYDRFGTRLYMLTSFEAEGGRVGGYLWVIGLRDLRSGEMPRLVRRPDGKPLKFTHKPEAVTVVDGATVLVVHDDDRVTGIPPATDPEKGPKRELHQSFYDVVRFE